MSLDAREKSAGTSADDGPPLVDFNSFIGFRKVHPAFNDELVDPTHPGHLDGLMYIMSVATYPKGIEKLNADVKGLLPKLPDLVEVRESTRAFEKVLVAQKAEQLRKEHFRNPGVKSLLMAILLSTKRSREKAQVPLQLYQIDSLGGRWDYFPKKGDPRIIRNSMKFPRIEGEEIVKVSFWGQQQVCTPVYRKACGFLAVNQLRSNSFPLGCCVLAAAVQSGAHRNGAEEEICCSNDPCGEGRPRLVEAGSLQHFELLNMGSAPHAHCKPGDRVLWNRHNGVDVKEQHSKTGFCKRSSERGLLPSSLNTSSIL